MTSLRKVFLGGMIVFGLLCAGGLVFIDGSYLPYKPCRPLRYQTDQRIGEGVTAEATTDTMTDVIGFYDLHLLPKANGIGENGQWYKHTSSSGISYSCSATDINLLTAETGCIDITKEGSRIAIRTELNRFEGSSLPCQGP